MHEVKRIDYHKRFKQYDGALNALDQELDVLIDAALDSGVTSLEIAALLDMAALTVKLNYCIDISEYEDDS